MSSARVRIFRELKRANAEKIHDSLWKSENVEFLIHIATFIKSLGGKARILEEKFIF
jgi:hypothetical protein